MSKKYLNECVNVYSLKIGAVQSRRGKNYQDSSKANLKSKCYLCKIDIL